MTVAELEVQLSLRMSQYERDMLQAQKRVEDLEKNADHASKGAATKIERNLERAAQSAKTIGNRLSMYVTAPIAGVIGAVGKMEVDFDASLRNVDSIAKLTGAQFEDLRKSVLSLAEDRHIRQGPDDLAKGLYDVYSSGFSGGKALEVLKVSAYGASAGLTDTATSSRVLMAVLNSGISGVTSTQQAMDVLFREVDLGVNTFGDLASQLGDVLPTARAAGVSLQEVAAAIASMTRQGISPAESVTALNAMLIHIMKPTDSAAKLMHNLGIEYGAAALQSKGLAGWLDQVQQKTHGNQQKLLEIMPEVRAFKAEMALAKNGGKDYAEMLGGMAAAGDGAGATMKALDRQMAGQKAQWDSIVKELKIAALEFGNDLAPAIRDLTGDVRSFVKWLRGLNDEQRTTMLKAALVVAALGPTARAFGGVASAIKGVIALRTAYAAWAAGAVAETEAVGASAVTASAELTGLKGILVGLASKTWVIPVAYLATKPMEFLGKDFMHGIPKAQDEDRDALHAAKENEKFRVGQAWPDVLAKSANDIRKATEAMVQRFGSGPSEIPESDVRGYIQEIVNRGSKNLANSMYGPIGKPYRDKTSIRPFSPTASNADVVTALNGDKEEKKADREAERLADAKSKLLEEIYLLTLAQKQGTAATDAQTLAYEIQNGLVDRGTEALQLQKLALLQKAEASEKAKKAQDDHIRSSQWYAEQLRSDAIATLEAQGKLSDLDRLSLQRFGKRYDQLAGGTLDGVTLTQQQRQQIILKDLEKERSEKAQSTAEWVKDQVALLQRELDLANLLTEVEKARYDIQQKRAKGEPVSADQESQILDVAKKKDSADWAKELSDFGDQLQQNLQDAVDATAVNKTGVQDRLAQSLQEQTMRLLETGSAADRAKAKLLQLAETMGYGDTQAQRIATGMGAARIAMDDAFEKDKIVEWRTEMENAAKMTEDAFMSAFDSILNGQTTVLGGLNKMLGDIAREALMSSVRSGLSSWIGGIFGSIGSGGSSGKADLYPSVGSISGYLASGGPTLAGRAYIVGENGPELMVPRSSGTVIPADETRDIMSRRGSGQVVNVTVHATDAGSFVHSKKQIADQVARELSAARGRR